jgi:TonB family protein
MLRLLQNKLSNKAIFFREIIVFVIFLHLFIILLFCLLGFQRHNNEKFTIRTESRLSSTVVFLPLKKYVDPAVNRGGEKRQHERHQSRKVMDYQSYLKQQGYNVVAAQKEPAAAVKSSGAKAPDKKSVVQDKKRPAVVESKKIADKKTVLQQEKKPAAVKKSSTKKVAAEVVKKIIKPEKKVEPARVKTDEAETKKTETVKTPEKNIEPVVAQSIAVPAATALQQAPSAVDLADVTFVGYRELEKLQLQSKIQQAVETYWSPPVGMAKNTVCELQVTINSAGAVAHVKIAKSSKIMAFDLAARAAIYRTKFPKDVWDKQIMIELGI